VAREHHETEGGRGERLIRSRAGLPDAHASPVGHGASGERPLSRDRSDRASSGRRGARGAHIDLRNWRKREWKPALEAAGLPRERRPYDLRHSFASWALAAGVPAYDVARYMGTSVRMLDLTYGHLVKGSEAIAVSRLDAYTAATAEASASR